MHRLFGRACIPTTFLALFSVVPICGQDRTLFDHILLVEDISPDQSNFTFVSPASASNDPGGRIMSLAIDPTDDSIVYAAAQFSGIWKSTSAAKWVGGPNAHSTIASMKWFQASKGLRNGLTQNNASLAVDAEHHKRLLYATQDDDGRPNNPLGGLWISTDAAESWSHVTLPSCNPANISSVAFASGQPFVSTRCGIWTSASSDLKEGSWTLLPTGPTGLTNAHVIDGEKNTLFACNGNQVFQATDLGKSGTWNSVTLSGSCFQFAAVPNGTAASTAVAVTWGLPTNNEVGVVNFTDSTITPLGFSLRPNQNLKPVQGAYGSGSFAVATVAIPSAPATPGGPGLTYDLYAADTCAWYAYNPGTTVTPPSWTMIGGASGATECNNPTSIHVDTWAMAFPSWYDPLKGLCAVYASTDGGVFFTGGRVTAPNVGGCPNNWGPAMRGLHVLGSANMFAITEGSKPFTSSLTEGIYLPTGDNDVFTTTFGWKNWQSLELALGDAGQAYVDAAFPDQVMVARNGTYLAVWSPPYIGGSQQNMVPSGSSFDSGIGAGGVSNLVQIMTTRAEFVTPPKAADYLAVINQDPKKCSAWDIVVRNISSPPSTSWKDISPADHFLACNIAKIQAGGGHEKGSLNVYVLTNLAGGGNFDKGRGAGQIYRGVVDTTTGLVNHWDPASGSSMNPLGKADNFYVNPYDPSELYAVSVQQNAILVSRNSGNDWNTDTTLTDLATNHLEYRFDCAQGGGPFTNTCSMSGIAFDVFAPHIRVACMVYGGLVFSRDDGNHWMALDVTNNNHYVSDNLTEMVHSCFYDGESHGTGPPKPSPIPGPIRRIYAALEGRSIKMVLGPFSALESLNFSYALNDEHVVNVVILNPPLVQQTIRLRRDGGIYRGSLLFDYKKTPTVVFQFTVDGMPKYGGIHTVSAAEITDGIATESH